MNFSSDIPLVMHVDLNSCFATIEQQANPLIRNRPVAVAAYPTKNGCILAASYEAKRLGVKTGMRIKDGLLFCPNMIVLGPDPNKYRHIHREFRKLLSKYTFDYSPKSIDEFVLHFDKTIAVHRKSMIDIGLDIKKQIREQIGDYLTVSIGISTNRFLAKQAAGITKPDGLDVIDHTNYEEIYKRLHVTDLTGIKERNYARLSPFGIHTTWDMYTAPFWKLKAAFKSINSYYWMVRLSGNEIDKVEFARRSYGNSYALPKPFFKESDLSPILMKLVTKMSGRVRKAGLAAHGIHLSVYFRDGTVYHRGYKTQKDLWSIQDFFNASHKILLEAPKKPVRNLAVSSFNLKKVNTLQRDLFIDLEKEMSLTNAVDFINHRYGTYTISPARMLPAKDNIPDRIAFGNVKELEELMN